MPSPSIEELARSLAVADLEGLYQKHTQMWDMFHSTLKVYGTVACLPLVVMGTLVTAGKYDVTVTPHLASLPFTIAGTFAVAGFLGVVLLLTLIRNRLDIILYARAINGIRDLYTSILKQDASLQNWQQYMPVSTEAPKALEMRRPMGHIVLAAAIINSVYITLGIFKLVAPCSEWFITAFAILSIILQMLLYRKSCADKFVLGGNV